MKLFLDTKARRFVKSAASNVALTTLVLKRRDQVPLEIVFVSNNAAIETPEGTETTVGLKRQFSDANFLALAAPGTDTLDLFTEPVEAAFLSANPASIPALLEVRWSAPGESLRTATLQVELQNSVILGDEGTPSAIPDLKATQAEAESGTNNTKWLTPLRTFQAIAAWVSANVSWSTLTGKPTTFPPSSHTHTAAQITDFGTAVIAAAPPTTNASLLTSGTLADARLSGTATASLAKADTAVQPADLGTMSAQNANSVAVSGGSINGTSIGATQPSTAKFTSIVVTDSDITMSGSGVIDMNAGFVRNLSAPVNANDAVRKIDLETESTTRSAADTVLGQRIDFLASNLDPAALDSIAEAAASIGTLQTAIDGKQPAGSYPVLDSDGGLTVSYLSASGYNLGGNNPQPGEIFLQAADSALGVSIRPATLSDDRVLTAPNANGTLALTSHADGRTQQLFFAGIASPAPSLGRTDDYYLRRDGSTSVTLFRKNDQGEWEPEATLATSGALSATTQSIADDLAAVQAAIPAPVTAVTTTHLGDGTTADYPVSGLISTDPSLLIVTINGVRQTPGTDYLVNLTSGGIVLDSPLPAGDTLVVTALSLYSPPAPRDPLGTHHASATDSADSSISYYGQLRNSDLPAAPALPETAATWSIRRLTLDSAGRIASRTRAVGRWDQRETLTYAP